MRYSAPPSTPNKEPSHDTGGISFRKGRVWIGVMGLLISPLGQLPMLLPQELFYATSPYRVPLLWALYVTPPLALVVNMVAVIFGRPRVLGAIGVMISLFICALWAKGLFLLFLLRQNGPICP
jgi:hypothetical protein